MTTAHGSYESSVSAAGMAKATADQNAWTAYWNSVNTAQQQFNQGVISNSTLQANLSAAVTTRNASLAANVNSYNSTVDQAKTALRAGGDASDPF
jgi:predicted TIM-barrel enzyme